MLLMDGRDKIMTVIANKEVCNHKEAMKLALRVVEERWQVSSELFGIGNYKFGGGNAERAEQVLQNYADTAEILNELIVEEEKAGY